MPRSVLVPVPCQQERGLRVSNQTLPIRWYPNTAARGFESTLRANELAEKIVAQNIKLGLNSSWTFFAPDNCKFPSDVLQSSIVYSLSIGAFPNDTLQPANYNYVDPSRPFSVNGMSDPTSQRFHDTCESSFNVEIPETPAFKPE